jgi:uncharacterized repeat protein (TIGR03803 family)
VLYNFTGVSGDGCFPWGGLLRDKAGILYGTTENCGGSGLGTVFKVSKTGKETVLHSFAGGSSDGANPIYTGLLMDATGNLYGVTKEGGASNQGVVYVLSKTGTFTVLYSFTGGTTDGCYPFGTPAMDADGNVYGTTEQCGSSGFGIVWKVSQNGTKTLLHNFIGGRSDGASPIAGVILDAKVGIYGSTGNGGTSNFGTVYELDWKSNLTLLHSFAGGSSDGCNPIGDVSRDKKGNLYGTTNQCGSSGYGTVWKLTP